MCSHSIFVARLGANFRMRSWNNSSKDGGRLTVGSVGSVGCAVNSQSVKDRRLLVMRTYVAVSLRALFALNASVLTILRRTIAFESEPSSVSPSSEEILRQFNHLCQQMYIACSINGPKKR